MIASAPLEALRAESTRLAAVLSGLDPADWARPTRCAPWDTAALAAHVAITLERLGPMLEAPEPAAAVVDAAGYYRPDERFAPAVNDRRLDDAAAAPAPGAPRWPKRSTPRVAPPSPGARPRRRGGA